MCFVLKNIKKHLKFLSTKLSATQKVKWNYNHFSIKAFMHWAFLWECFCKPIYILSKRQLMLMTSCHINIILSKPLTFTHWKMRIILYFYTSINLIFFIYFCGQICSFSTTYFPSLCDIYIYIYICVCVCNVAIIHFKYLRPWL